MRMLTQFFEDKKIISQHKIYLHKLAYQPKAQLTQILVE